MNDSTSYRILARPSEQTEDSLDLPNCPSLDLTSLSPESDDSSDSALFGSGETRSTQTICTCTCVRRKRGEGKMIYVTMAEDSEQHVHEVEELCEILKDEGFDIITDIMSTLIMGGPMNVNDWRDRNFREAHLVIVCISPKYAEYCCPPSDMDVNEDIPNENRLAVRYIFNHIRSEIKDEL